MILLLLHEDQFRNKLASYLSEHGYEVVTPQHRSDTLPLAKRKHPSLVIIDMYLMDPSPFQNLQELRNMGFDGPVLALAGPSARDKLKETIPLGLNEVISAPYDCGRIYHAIRSQLGDPPGTTGRHIEGHESDPGNQ